MNNSHHLNVIENCLDTKIGSKAEADLLFSKLSWKQIYDIEDRMIEFESAWQPQQRLSADIMHIGRAFYTLSNPHSWIGKMAMVDGPFDVEKLTRMLIYLPGVSVWLPAIERDDFGRKYGHSDQDAMKKTKSRICQLAGKLSFLRPFLDDGSLTIVPDRFYSDVCKWNFPPDFLTTLKMAVAGHASITPHIKALVASALSEESVHVALREQFAEDLTWIEDLKFPADTPSDMLRLAREESQDRALREHLDKFPFLEGAENLCSDSRYIWGLKNAEAIKYINPLNEVNEDQVVQVIIGSSSLCTDGRMFELLKQKHVTESQRTSEMVWTNSSVFLPGLSDIALRDLVSVRQNEDAFHAWRMTLGRAIRKLENLTPGTNVEKEAQHIFREEVQPIGMHLNQKIKSKSLKSVLKNGAVSFGSAAVAAYAINPNPALSIATGGLSSTLKMAYDVWDSKGIKPDKALFRMLSVFEEKR